jgi:hypothetical protein
LAGKLPALQSKTHLLSFNLKAIQTLKSLFTDFADSVNDDASYGWDYFSFVCKVGCEGHKHKLHAVWHFDKGSVVSRCASPTRF